MQLGLWKEREDIIIPIQEFIENGGILTEGREIWIRDDTYRPYVIGHWMRYSKKDKKHIMMSVGLEKNVLQFMPSNVGIKVKCKVIYK